MQLRLKFTPTSTRAAAPHGFNIDRAVHAEFKKACDQDGRPASQVVEALMRLYIEQSAETAGDDA